MIAGDGEATVSEAEEVLLLVVDQSAVSLPYLVGFHLQVVAQRRVPLFLLGAPFATDLGAPPPEELVP